MWEHKYKRYQWSPQGINNRQNTNNVDKKSYSSEEYKEQAIKNLQEYKKQATKGSKNT